MSIINNKTKGLIKRLRSLGGQWHASREGFGTYFYEGYLDGNQYTIYSRSHWSPRYEGDDETFVSLWHIEKNFVQLGWPTSDPIFIIENELNRDSYKNNDRIKSIL